MWKGKEMLADGVSWLLKCLSLCLWSLQGGVNDELTLSAYITIALLEMPLPATVCSSTSPVPPSHM